MVDPGVMMSLMSSRAHNAARILRRPYWLVQRISENIYTSFIHR